MEKSKKLLRDEREQLLAKLAAEREVASEAPGIMREHDPERVVALRARLAEVDRLLAAG